MSRHIQDPTRPFATQGGLFGAPGIGPYTKSPWPDLTHSMVQIIDRIRSAQDRLGFDAEFDPATLRPTVIGVGGPGWAGGMPWNDNVAWELMQAAQRGVKIVTYSGLGERTDKAVLEHKLRMKTQLNIWTDAMIKHYLANMDFAKSDDKGEDEGESGSIGLFNLWAFVSFYLDVPQWKYHRGLSCEGPCPRCLRGESLVYLADGSTERIAKLVKDGYRGLVKCVDDSGNIVARRVTNTYANARNGRKFVRVWYDNMVRCSKTNVGTIMTADHPVLTTEGYIPAGQVEGKYIATGTPDLTEYQKHILCGLMLGDSHVHPKGEITFTHGWRQREYLDCKRSLFSEFGGRLDDREGSATWKVATHPVFKDIANRFRNDWRAYLAENFSWESLIVWFLDDGSYHRYQGILSISSYSDEEADFLCALIRQKTGLHCDIHKGRTVPKGRNHAHRVIVFPADSMKELSERAAEYTPDCLRYKLYPLPSLSAFQAKHYSPEVGPVYYSLAHCANAQGRINWRNGNECDNTVFCLEVEEFNNFITRAGVVHNCSVFDYCAIDAWSGVAADYEVDKDLARKKVPTALYDHVANLTDLCGRITEQGVCIDMDVVRRLESDADARKEALFPFEKHGKKKVFQGPFNPNSSDQIIEYFETQKIKLKTTDKKEVLAKLRSEAQRRGWTVEDLDNVDEAELGDGLHNLHKLYQYKSTGKSFDAWVSQRYFGRDGRIHPRFIATGTSTGRLASSSPNFQNLPRVTGAGFRRCIIPPSNDFTIVKADYSQLELGVCLWYAGVERPKGDTFKWLVSQAPEDFDTALVMIGNPKYTTRDVAKSVSHAYDYLEGLLLLTPQELGTERRISERRYGALLVFDGREGRPLWTFRNKIVCFSGVNLGQRLFGDKSFESRKKALQIQEVYTKALPHIREWHMQVTAFVEENGAIRSASGRYLELYGDDVDDLKIAAAFLGQGSGADLVQEKMIEHDKAGGVLPILQIHDELVLALPRSWSDRECWEYMQFMSTESKIFPGLRCPVKVSRGDNWGSCKEIIP